MRWTQITAMFVIVSMLAGCATYAPIGIQTSDDGDIRLSAPINPGDRVRVVKKSGETSTFRVVVVEQDRVSSDTLTYMYEDLESIEVARAQDERATLIIVIGVIAVVAMLALLSEIEDDIECTFGNC